MGLWSKIKGWLNIGGVSVKLWKFREPLRRSDPGLARTLGDLGGLGRLAPEPTP
jgi:hypothetical protein